MGKSPMASLDAGAVTELGFGAALYATAGLAEAAEGVLRALQGGSPIKARSWLAREVDGVLDRRWLDKLMALEPIRGFRKASFPNRDVMSGRGKLAGTLTLRSGAVVPVQIDLVREEDAWKVCGIVLPSLKG